MAESWELANRFYAELDRVLALITANPQAGRAAAGDTRKVTMRRFPFDVVYKLIQDEAVIYALAPHSKKPDYWIERL